MRGIARHVALWSTQGPLKRRPDSAIPTGVLHAGLRLESDIAGDNLPVGFTKIFVSFVIRCG